jgi:hypothetical protein
MSDRDDVRVARGPASGVAAPPAGTAYAGATTARPPAAHPAPALPPTDGVPRARGLIWIVCLAAAVGGALTTVTPSGNGVADRVLAAGFAAAMAAAASPAARWTWFVASGAGLALASGWLGVATGGAALLLAWWATRPTRPDPVVAATVGGLSAIALLAGQSFLFQGASALVVAAASAPLLVSGLQQASSPTRRRVAWALAVVVVAAIGVSASYGAALARSRTDVETGMRRLEDGLSAAREGDEVVASQQFGEAAEAFTRVEGTLDAWWARPAEALPLAGHNARAIRAMTSTAAELSREGRALASEVVVDQLTVTGGRLDLEQVRSLGQPLVDVAATLDDAVSRLDAADTTWLLAPVADRLDRVQREIADARPDARLAADAVEVIPGIFGADGDARWLVVFTTPAEARGRSGLPGNYAELVAVDGAVDMPVFGRISDLEGNGPLGASPELSGPEDFLARWGRYLPGAAWRNATMSPDFPSVGQIMSELYPQSGGSQVDGVIVIDPVALAALLEFTGPVEVPGVGEPLTAQNAAEFMLLDQYVEFEQTGERVDVLETLARTTFDRLTSGDLPSPRVVADTLGPAVSEGHIQLYSSHADQQALFTDIGADGALPPVEGDFLAVVNSNATGNKIDSFLSRDIDYHAVWDPTSGDVTATLSVTLVNHAPDAGLPDYIIGNALLDEGLDLPRGTNRTHLSIYSPLALDGADLDSGPVAVTTEVERGRYAYSLFLDVPPNGGTRTVTLTLRGSVPIDGDTYRLDVAGQPLRNPDQLTLRIESAPGEPVVADEPLQAEPGGRVAGATITSAQSTDTYRVRVDR